MKNQIKELRVKIDGLAQLTKELKPIGKYLGGRESESSKPVLFNSKEIEKAVDSLYLAKAWLGKMLGELGTETPYANDGKRKSVENIELTADVSSGQGLFKDDFELLWWRDELNHIEKVDWLRQEIKKLINNSEDFSEKESNIELEQGFVYKYLCEARFWLGFELQRIKENE